MECDPEGSRGKWTLSDGGCGVKRTHHELNYKSQRLKLKNQKRVLMKYLVEVT